MPPTTNNIGEDNDVRFLVNMLANCGELNLDPKGLAKAEGIAQQYNVYPRMRRIVRKYGFTYDSGSKRIVKIDCEGDGGKSAETPKKPASSKKPAAATPGTSKKHKLTEPASADEQEAEPVKEEQQEQEEIVLEGPIMDMETTPGFGWFDSNETEADAC